MEQDRVFERLQKSPFFRFFEALYRMVVVNLCILLLSVCGLVVFGIFPAIFAAAAYFNDAMEGREGRVLPAMFGYFKRFFLIGNLHMLVAAPALAMIFYLMFGPELNTVLYLLIFCWILAALILNWFLPAVNVLYPEFETGKKFAFSLVASAKYWKLSLLFLLCGVGWLYAAFLVPQLMMFVLISVPVWFGVWRVKKALKPDSFYDPDEEERELAEEERMRMT